MHAHTKAHTHARQHTPRTRTHPTGIRRISVRLSRKTSGRRPSRRPLCHTTPRASRVRPSSTQCRMRDSCRCARQTGVSAVAPKPNWLELNTKLFATSLDLVEPGQYLAKSNPTWSNPTPSAQSRPEYGRSLPPSLVEPNPKPIESNPTLVEIPRSWPEMNQMW